MVSFGRTGDSLKKRLSSSFGEVVLIAAPLRLQGVLSQISERVRFARWRFGHYEVVDFLAVLFGYAISGERPLQAFYERLEPFADPFMVLFGRERLPARFIAMLTYKAELVGIQVILQEESHTSKCSFLDNEPICHHERYMGKRVKRGLFRTATGRRINADVNGSLNIIRKARDRDRGSPASRRTYILSNACHCLRELY